MKKNGLKSWSDITYSNPGQKDHVFICKLEGQRQHKQTEFLLW